MYAAAVAPAKPARRNASVKAERGVVGADGAADVETGDEGGVSGRVGVRSVTSPSWESASVRLLRR